MVFEGTVPTAVSTEDGLDEEEGSIMVTVGKFFVPSDGQTDNGGGVSVRLLDYKLGNTL